MNKTYEKAEQKVQTGYQVVITCKTKYSPVEIPWETMYIDVSGEVVYIDHDASWGHGSRFGTYRRENPDFHSCVKFFMKKLLEKNLEEFKEMRSVLTGEWYELAEEVRMDAISKLEF